MMERVLRLSEQELDMMEMSLNIFKENKIDERDVLEQVEALLKRIEEVR